MSDQEFHQQYPDEYEDGHLEAVGALIGWMGGKGEPAPKVTPALREAYEQGARALASGE